jgi:transposase
MTTTLNHRTQIGVGFDTARYGHRVTFLREDRQPAAKPLELLESRSSYEQVERVFRQLHERYGDVHFRIHVDAAGQYASNILAFLESLPWPKTISIGNPLRNKRYREVHFPKRKSDATESQACARYAIVERPDAMVSVPAETAVLQEVAGRLEFQTKQTTRQTNRLHLLLARVFPELPTLTPNICCRSILELLEKYPSAQRIARAQLDSLAAIPYLTRQKAQPIQAAAKTSVACHKGEIVEELLRESVRDLRQALAAEARLEKLLVRAFDALSDERIRQLRTIPGLGRRTAAVLAAKIVSIERFPTPDHLVSYFGVFPEEHSSGVDPQGQPLPAGKWMSRQGNDLVRKHLWMAAQVALRSNRQVRELYARLRARGRRGDVALGHCMRKLLHQAFGIWTSGRAYDAAYPDGRATAPKTEQAEQPAPATGSTTESEPGSNATVDPAPTKKAAGRRTGISPERQAVTATSAIVAHEPAGQQEVASIDFAWLRSQVTMEQVLRHLGYYGRLRGNIQRRGPCPVHGTKRDRGRTFSVHLGKNVFQCFHPPCGAAGNVLDLWCDVHHLTPYEGALSLAQTFGIQLDTQQRRGTRTSNQPQQNAVITADGS